MYREEPEKWATVVHNCMTHDTTWQSAAVQYEQVLQQTVRMVKADLATAYKVGIEKAKRQK